MGGWISPKSYFGIKDISIRRIISINFFLFLLGLCFLCLSTLSLVEVKNIREIIVLLLFTLVIVTPFYYILNFMYSILISFIMLLARQQHFLIWKVYGIVLYGNTFMFFFNTIALYIILISNKPAVFFISVTVLMIVNLMGVRILYYGFKNFAGLAKKPCLVTVLIILTISYAGTILGVFKYVN